MLEPATESQIDTPSSGRLVIRIKLIPQAPPQPARRYLNKSSLLILGAVAALLGWLAISTFRSDPTPPPAATGKATNAVAVHSPEPPPISVEPEVQQQPDAPPSSVTEAIPDVPQSALNTIRGTVRVSVRVNVDKQGTVVDATAVDRGPSRYFERLAVEAAKKWTFTPATSDEPRIMLVRFNFTRAGATANASPPQ